MTARKRIIRVAPLSIAKIFGLIGGIVGLVQALLIGVIAVLDRGSPVEIYLLPLFPIFYALAGFIGGLVHGVVYNIAANAVGGIIVDLADEQPWE